MDILKQSTAVTIVMGPMLDSTDGNTQETGLTIAQADIRLSKNGGAYAQTNNVAGATHMEVGNYSVPLDTTDTGTLGKVRVSIHESGALAVWREFTIVPANVYDSLVLGTDVLTADVTQWLGTAAATPTVAGVPEVDVTHWLGTSVTANVAGQPTVDITRVGASTQSLIDLKDFVDSGYDPATNKVQGVVLVDTTTTNTDMVGTNSAALASVCTEARLAELDAANLPTDIADIPTVAEFEARSIAAADYVVTTDTIAGVTTATNLTNAPTNGDLTATMKTSVNTEVADVTKTDTISEIAQGTPTATPTLEAAIMYLYMAWRNETTTTATTHSVKNDGGTVITKATISDDATTFTKGEMISGP